ncbi:MAG: hypothetical protein LBS54_04925 [Dysgonamonadaceae bacterium]|jgi:cell division protein FtsL|nr:hypothetical protein [Dysgonamonadaceae bacterium]
MAQSTLKQVAKIIRGDLFDGNFIKKYYKMMILLLVLGVFEISIRYACTKNMRQIERLKVDLQVVKYENYLLSKEITSNSRRTTVEDQLQKNGINLSSDNTVIYEINR